MYTCICRYAYLCIHAHVHVHVTSSYLLSVYLYVSLSLYIHIPRGRERERERERASLRPGLQIGGQVGLPDLPRVFLTDDGNYDTRSLLLLARRYSLVGP